MLLHILTHIDTDHIILIVKQGLGQRFRKLGLADTGRSQEQEGTNRLGRILDSGFGTNDGFGHFLNTLVLTDHTLMQHRVHIQDLASLAFIQLAYRNAGPSGNDPCNLFLCHTLVYQTQILILHFLFFSCQFFLQLRQLTVLQLCRFIQIIFLLSLSDIAVDLLDLLTQCGKTIYGCLFILPLSFLGCKLVMKLCQILLQIFQTFLAQMIRLFLQCRLLDLHLHDLT